MHGNHALPAAPATSPSVADKATETFVATPMTFTTWMEPVSMVSKSTLAGYWLNGPFQLSPEMFKYELLMPNPCPLPEKQSMEPLQNFRVRGGHVGSLPRIVAQVEELPIRGSRRLLRGAAHDPPITEAHCPAVGFWIPDPVQIALIQGTRTEKQGAEVGAVEVFRKVRPPMSPKLGASR